MSNFICKKCGSTEYEIKDKPNGTGIAHGLYCAKCGFWHKWLGKEELKLYDKKENKDEVIALLQAENAELKARLEKAVELPCKVGDTVYSIFEFPNEKAILKGTCEHIDINIFSGFPEIFIKLVFETNEQLFLRTYSGNALNNIFLLRSEAEARLAELKKTYNQ